MVYRRRITNKNGVITGESGLIFTKPTKKTEFNEQRILVDWLDNKNILFCHVPNGGLRRNTAAFYKHIGLKKGVPDILIFTKPPRWPSIRGIAIELKVSSGLRKEQKEWLLSLKSENWITYVAYSGEDAIVFLEQLGF